MTLVRTIARPMLAAPFILEGIERLRHPERAAVALRPVLEQVGRQVPQARQFADRPELAARVVGGVQVGAGALLATGKFPRLASLLIVAAQSTALAQDFMAAEDGRSKPAAIAGDLGLTGGALLASVDTDGQPSLAWRARAVSRRASRTVQRDARKAKKAAKKALND